MRKHKHIERSVWYRVNDWKPAEFIATKGQTDAELLAFFQSRHPGCTITILPHA